MGGIFPRAPALADFWKLVEQGRDTCGPVPAGRWLLDPDLIRNAVPGSADAVSTDRGCFIEGFSADPSALGSPRELGASLDPAFHLLAHAGRTAFAQARTDTLDLSRVGVIIGNIALPTAGSSSLCNEVLAPLLEQRISGRAGPRRKLESNALNRYSTGLPASLLASALGLGGGSYALDAACASSLYAVKLACDELLEQRACAMLAGGLSRPDSLYTQMGFSQLRALSPSGRCSPFDRSGDGLVVGEGAGIVALKRLQDALRDGDRILALIRGVGLSNDVDGNLLSPGSEGQLRALRLAYAQAGWSPDMVDLIECHATGTPLGDAVEFESLTRLWQGGTWQSGQCVLSAVKSNIGHLLTAAGSAGLIKTVLAMQEGTLPPVANFENPAEKIRLDGSPFSILKRSRPWERRGVDVPRRAAINGFGFGGINAHLLIEEALPEQLGRSRTARKTHTAHCVKTPEPIAIVGMAVHVGRWPDLNAFRDRVFDAGPGDGPVQRAEWRGLSCEEIGAVWGDGGPAPQGVLRGYYLDELSVPIDRFHVPPRELAEMLPQQLLMLDVAKAALDDAGGPVLASSRSGVFIGLGLDLRTTDFHFRWAVKQRADKWAREAGLDAGDAGAKQWITHLREGAGPALTADRTLGALGGIVASRVAREFHVGGPSHTVCSEDTSGLRAVEVAARALRRGELDVALAGAVDLNGDLRTLLASDAVRPYSRAGSARPFDADADGAVPGEGAACIVLKRLADAQRDGDRIYALIRGVGAAQASGGSANMSEPTAYEQALARAYSDAGVAPSGVQFVESHGSGSPEEDAAEARALTAFFGRGSNACNVGSVKADVGHTGAASGLVSLVKASLCLYHEVIPGLRNFRSPRGELDHASGVPGVRVPRVARHWLRNRAEGPRRAAVSSMGVKGDCMHIVLDAWEATPLFDAAETGRNASPLPSVRPIRSPEALFTISAQSQQALRAAMNKLEQLAGAAADAPVQQIAQQWWKSHRDAAPGPHRVALLARDVSQLVRLTRQAASANANTDALAASGNAEDRERMLTRKAPASGHPGRIAFVFPGSGNQFEDMGLELAHQWPEILRVQDVENARLASQYCADQFWNGPLAANVLADHRTLILGQVAFGTMVADLATRFGIRPTAAVGYSLGESTALFAMRAWRQRDEMLDRLGRSSLFAHDLAGKPEVLRRLWKLPEGRNVEWITGMVDRSAETVRAAIGRKKRVYLLIVNTADECVIGGDRTAVDEVVAAIGCHWFPLQGVSTVHCNLARPVRKAYRQLHCFDTKPPADLEFYSCAWGRAYIPDRDSAADAIEAQALDTIDFPRVIRAAYAAGVRTFVEIGPGNTCSRMIGKILKDLPHFARSLAVPGQPPVTHFLRTIGQLFAENVPVDLDILYGGEDAARAGTAAAGRRVAVSITGAPISVPPLPRGDRARGFAAPMTPERADTKRSRTPAHPSSDRVPADEHAVLQAAESAERATLDAHEAYLRFSEGLAETLAHAVAAQVALLDRAARAGVAISDEDASRQEITRTPAVEALSPPGLPATSTGALAPTNGVPRSLDRAACLAFGRGLVAGVLGPRYAAADAFPTRVRLPDEPLMLVDRVLQIDGEPLSLAHGRIVTEHDITPGAWYLDCGRIPTCIAVEAGQADLLLAGFLGIDFQTRGEAMYRLLDAKVCFHRSLPGADKVVRYDIRIERFFRQGDAWLFKFAFEASVDGEPLLTMTDGCAGFFSRAELEGGKGIVHTALDLKPVAGKRPADWKPLVEIGVERYDEEQLDALRGGDLAACFGDSFAGLPLAAAVTLPAGRMNLVHRIAHLDPAGGRFGLGIVRGEADIHPQDWFLTCHFVDDRVMPGTLMFECCLHTLRVFLLRLGWVAEQGQVAIEPVPGVASQLKCRGQVLDTTKQVAYVISIKEIGYRPEPYVIADALMYADGKPIVEITGMSLRYAGVTRETLRSLWAARKRSEKKPALFDSERILAFAVGKPSDAFGERYRIFDRDRVIARLPGPPYQFLDRITEIRAEPWTVVPGGEIEAQYDVPEDAWYFAANRQGDMPFAVVLEIALQPCGWLAAYMGSALTSDVDLSFRNLGGSATQFAPVFPGSGTLSTRVKLTRASSSAGMIIQFFDYEVRAGSRLVYRGDTYFGFFPKIALAKQEGLKDARRYQPTAQESSRSRRIAFPQTAPFPGDRLRLLDRIECWIPDGGPKALGYIRAMRRVDPGEWFFKAHFFQDPVVPGSLGLEAFLQLLKFISVERWGGPPGVRHEAVAMHERHEWTYRGQVIPADAEVAVEAEVTEVDDERLTIRADGFLSVDGRVIYAMQDFTLRQRRR
ncbi:MAG: hypothetical protein A3G25_13125 [Betaproteobacteria bacterium RIFCSPLOWO2_12_FULL_63_13]|nr:MAG: hypothetical protein A3G25_13125 [Betaproteobacteria bacterium RIFCSPLOWO2_12_FULL_63_13]